jgi:hypothetical protein
MRSFVTYGEYTAVAQPHATAATTKTPPNIVKRDIAFVVLLNICGMTHKFRRTRAKQVPCQRNTSGFNNVLVGMNQGDGHALPHSGHGLPTGILALPLIEVACYRQLPRSGGAGGCRFCLMRFADGKARNHEHQTSNDVVDQYRRAGMEPGNKGRHNHP